MKLLLLAGEESGVMYAERIAEAVRGKAPSVEIRGYGDYGFKTSDLAVMGVGQVLKKIFYFLRVKRTMLRAIDEWNPDVVCTVDYPGMNLKLAGKTANVFSAPPGRLFAAKSLISSTNGWPTNSAKPDLKSAGSNGKKQQSLSSDASIFGMRPFFHAQTWGQTTCTARMPFAFACAASFKFIPG